MHRWISIKHSKLQYRVTIWGTTFYIRSPWNRPLEALGMRAALPVPSCPHCLKWELRVQNCFFTALHTSTYELAVENKKQLCQATVETDLMELDLRIQKPVVILLRLREVKEFAQDPKAQDFNYLSLAINWNIHLFIQTASTKQQLWHCSSAFPSFSNCASTGLLEHLEHVAAIGLFLNPVHSIVMISLWSFLPSPVKCGFSKSVASLHLNHLLLRSIDLWFPAQSLWV